VPLPGEILRREQATTTSATSTSSTTFVDTNLSASITPMSAANLVEVSLSGNVYSSTSTRVAIVHLYRDATDLGPGFGAYTGATDTFAGGSIRYVDAPQSASSLTYKARLRVDNAANTGIFPVDLDPGAGTDAFATMILNEMMT
jgi:multidrug efflux pump subunit AcrA (membrane-fusion protein)